MKLRHSLIAALVVSAASAAYAAANAHLEVLWTNGYGGTTIVKAHKAPADAWVEGVINYHGQDVTVDACAICNYSGKAKVRFPAVGSHHRIILRNSAGTVLSTTYTGIAECD